MSVKVPKVGNEPLALISPRAVRTYTELEQNANRLVSYLRQQGLVEGDSVAMICCNRVEFIEVYMACQRGGWWFTPMNRHLKVAEIQYVLEDSGAAALFAEDSIAPAVEAAAGLSALKVRVSIGPLGGFKLYDSLMLAAVAEVPEAGIKAGVTRYTSGTTGRPKGVRKPEHRGQDEEVRRKRWPSQLQSGQGVVLCNGPLYHAAPMKYDLLLPLKFKVTVILTDKWDPEETLRLIEKYGVTHMHMVPSMFKRMLDLPAEVRQKYDISSIEQIVHGAAPTPIPIKKAMIDWMGPVLFEYYGGSEGGGTDITSQEWLQKPGSVGRAWHNQVVTILDGEGQAQPVNKIGNVYFGTPKEGAFYYHNDPEKTRSAFSGNYFTLGDQGYLDEDGFLFLTGRTSELIIAGGVNIYPAEVDAVLLTHEYVADVATIGIPHDSWGEEVKSVVVLRSGSSGLASEENIAEKLMEHCRKHLAKFKCPRSIDFVEDLPRTEAGKIQRHLVRKPFWVGRQTQI